MPAASLFTRSAATARIAGFEERPEVIELTQTSMPNWGGTGWTTPVLPPESAVVVFAFGAAAADAWPGLLGLDAAPRPVRVEEHPAEWSPETAAAIARAIDGAVAGSRLAFVGPETAILPAIAVAKKSGLNEDEYTSASIGTVVEGVADAGFTAGTALRPIFCPHCHTTYNARLAVGDAFDCPNCGTALAVYYHYSPFRGAYLARPTGEENPA